MQHALQRCLGGCRPHASAPAAGAGCPHPESWHACLSLPVSIYRTLSTRICLSHCSAGARGGGCVETEALAVRHAPVGHRADGLAGRECARTRGPSLHARMAHNRKSYHTVVAGRAPPLLHACAHAQRAAIRLLHALPPPHPKPTPLLSYLRNRSRISRSPSWQPNGRAYRRYTAAAGSVGSSSVPTASISTARYAGRGGVACCCVDAPPPPA